MPFGVDDAITGDDTFVAISGDGDIAFFNTFKVILNGAEKIINKKCVKLPPRGVAESKLYEISTLVGFLIKATIEASSTCCLLCKKLTFSSAAACVNCIKCEKNGYNFNALET